MKTARCIAVNGIDCIPARAASARSSLKTAMRPAVLRGEQDEPERGHRRGLGSKNLRPRYWQGEQQVVGPVPLLLG